MNLSQTSDNCQQQHNVPKCKYLLHFRSSSPICFFWLSFNLSELCCVRYFFFYCRPGRAHYSVGVCTEYSEHKVRDRPVWLFRETKQCAYRAICHTHVSAHDDILTPVLFSSFSYSNKVENSAQNKIWTTTTTPCHLLRP